jgi:hypothetical protein
MMMEFMKEKHAMEKNTELVNIFSRMVIFMKDKCIRE